MSKQKEPLARTKIEEVLSHTSLQQDVCVKGWVRTVRTSKNVVFISLNDGSSLQDLQIVATPDQITSAVQTGTSLHVIGQVVSSRGTAQSVELQLKHMSVLGEAIDYPIQPKKHSLAFLRSLPHLRFRTHTFGAVFRVRHAVSYAIHTFFQERGFLWVHTPLITTLDAEGGGEVFRVLASAAPGTTEQAAETFFGQKAYLTVSGQLEAEAAALGLGQVYTFGPSFRAENSHTTRHLAEFWMIEPEMAFANLEDSLQLAKALLQYVAQYVLAHCPRDLTFLEKRAADVGKSMGTLSARLEALSSRSFARVTYTEAMEILQDAVQRQPKKFKHPTITWGMDLQSEHERFLSEEYFQSAVAVTHYPQEIKAFYMRRNDDGRTVACMDVLLPGIGEIVGGSEREERLNRLETALQERNMPAEMLHWYLDTRRFGTAPHSGFGLGLERLLQYVTGMENIRDVIPFPRTPA